MELLANYQSNPMDEGATPESADSEDEEVPGPKDIDGPRAHRAVGQGAKGSKEIDPMKLSICTRRGNTGKDFSM